MYGNDIDAVMVRRLCPRHDSYFGRCRDVDCGVCRGEGAYLIELDWRDFVAAIREEMEPGPSSG